RRVHDVVDMNELLRPRQAAERIMALHLQKTGRSDNVALEAVEVFNKLIPGLASFIGDGGNLALIRRTLKLNEKKFPGLKTVWTCESLPDLLDSLSRLLQEQRETAGETAVECLASYLELVSSFIGERLTWRVLRDIWPELKTEVKELNI
ncbi:MAG TPA: hypothetical protein VFG71_02830, partial [Nitrospiraceae bacterium]|nr:hypothetical protein [Nitrospiraceae bacterium]